MGMSTRVVGIKPPTAEYRKMAEVWRTCTEANVPIPRVVSDFFEDTTPDPAGMEVEVPCTPYTTEYASGFEVPVKTLPKGVTVIRFYNSW